MRKMVHPTVGDLDPERAYGSGRPAGACRRKVPRALHFQTVLAHRCLKDYTVISLRHHQQPVVQVEDEKLMFKVIRASFNQRRKTLANGLNNYGGINLTKEQIQQSIEELGVPVNIRGEALSLEQFACLSNIIGKKLVK